MQGELTRKAQIYLVLTFIKYTIWVVSRLGVGMY